MGGSVMTNRFNPTGLVMGGFGLLILLGSGVNFLGPISVVLCFISAWFFFAALKDKWGFPTIVGIILLIAAIFAGAV